MTRQWHQAALTTLPPERVPVALRDKPRDRYGKGWLDVCWYGFQIWHVVVLWDSQEGEWTVATSEDMRLFDVTEWSGDGVEAVGYDKVPAFNNGPDMGHSRHPTTRHAAT